LARPSGRTHFRKKYPEGKVEPSHLIFKAPNMFLFGSSTESGSTPGLGKRAAAIGSQIKGPWSKYGPIKSPQYLYRYSHTVMQYRHGQYGGLPLLMKETGSTREHLQPLRFRQLQCRWLKSGQALPTVMQNTAIRTTKASSQHCLVHGLC